MILPLITLIATCISATLATFATLPLSLFGKLSYRSDRTVVYDYDETKTFFKMINCSSDIIENQIKDNTELENDFQYVKLLLDRINCGKDFKQADIDNANYVLKGLVISTMGNAFKIFADKAERISPDLFAKMKKIITEECPGEIKVDNTVGPITSWD